MSQQKINKTNAARLLDKAGVAYRLIPYTVDPDDLAAAHVAEELGEDIRRVFKTIVLHGERTGHFVCVVPGNREVDLKKAAKAAGDKKAELIAMKELLPLTGYIRGGCSPIGMKKHFPTFIDATATGFDTIYVSAGVRGLQAEISPADLAAVARASFQDISTSPDNE
ncbi:MAG: Cys-tRNA(Pro) deacylase [Muribaculaceae bacterium]|nr:Cys-tRNA(Pro) deacylase [Muribaculaceae bacterium]